MSSNRSPKVPMAKGLGNRMLISLLSGRAGTLLGRHLAVVDYVGRRSGDRHLLVTLYAAEGATVRIRVGLAGRKTWWRNFEDPHPLHLRLAGAEYEAVARVVRTGNEIRVVADLGRRAVTPSGYLALDPAGP